MKSFLRAMKTRVGAEAFADMQLRRCKIDYWHALQNWPYCNACFFSPALMKEA